MAGNYTWEQRGAFMTRHFGQGYVRGIDNLLAATETIAGAGNVDSAKPRSPSSRAPRKGGSRKSSRSAAGATN
jgi:hypothetical protein